MSNNNIIVPEWVIAVLSALMLALIALGYFLGHKQFSTENQTAIADVRATCDAELAKLRDDRDKRIADANTRCNQRIDQRDQKIDDNRSECSKEKADIRAACSKEKADIRAKCSKEEADIKAKYDAMILQMAIDGKIIASKLKELLLNMEPATSVSTDTTSYIESIINPYLLFLNKLDSTTQQNIKLDKRLNNK